MRNRLSSYSVVLLVALAIVFVVLFVINPFGGQPSGATAQVQSSSSSLQGGSSSPGPFTQGGIASSGGPQAGGASGDHDGDHDYQWGTGGLGGAGRTTTTATTSVPAQDE